MLFERPQAEKNIFSDLTAENILDYDKKGMMYHDMIEFRKRLREIRK